MDFLVLDIGQDVSRLLIEYGPIVVAIFLLIVLMLYVLAYISRFFQYLKMQESRYLDVETLDFIHKVLEWVWIGFMAILALFVAQLKSPEIREFLRILIVHVPAIFFVVMVIFISIVLVKVVHRSADYLRGELKTKPKRIAPPRLLGFTELFLKYFIYIVGGVIAFVGGLAALPQEDQGVKAWIEANVFVPLGQPATFSFIGFLIIAILATLIAVRLIESILEDLKKTAKKFSEKVLDALKPVVRYTLYTLAGILVLFALLDVILTDTLLIVVALLFVLVLISLILASGDTIRNAFSGISLMMSDPFDEGDRVKIGNELVCDVLSMDIAFTRVKTLRGEVVSIPNRELMTRTIINFSRSDAYAISLDVKVSFEVSHQKVEELLLEAAKRTKGIVDEPKPQVFGKDMETNAIVHQLLAYTHQPDRMKEIKSELVYNVQDLFHEKGIKVLFSGG